MPKLAVLALRLLQGPKRAFALLLLLLLLFTFYCLSRYSHKNSGYGTAKQMPPEAGERQQRVGMNLTSALIVDPSCLEALAAERDCNFPLRIAVAEGSEVLDASIRAFVDLQYWIEDRPERDFWLFRMRNNGAKAENRATKRFPTSRATLRLQTHLSIELEVPEDPLAFVNAWRRGRFFECEPMLERPSNTTRVIPLNYVKRIAQFTDLLGRHGATGFIFSGTLLGWRRECSLIPHTNDVDIAMLSEEHSEGLLRAVLTSATFVVHWLLGRLRDSFELSVNVDGFKIDLFYVYADAKNNGSFVGGMRPDSKQRLRWRYPRVEYLCAGALLDHLVHVPCNFDAILRADYGADWAQDVDTGSFVWDKGHRNKESLEVYPPEEWPFVFLLVRNKTERFDPAVVDRWMANVNRNA